jgi:AraC-like DNA-binding protein
MIRYPGMPLLGHRPIFHTNDADAVRDFISAVGFDIAIEGRRGAHGTCINGVYLRDSYIGYIQYGAPVRIRTTPRRTDYWLQLPVKGAIEIGVGSAILDCGTETGVLGSPAREHVLTAGAGSARVQVSITGPALWRHLTALLGDAPAAPLEMALALDLRSGVGRKLSSFLKLALADLERGREPWTPAAMTAFEQTLMTMLLLEHPHNHSDALQRLARPIAPRAVKRALDFMHANLAGPLTLADVVAMAGVPGRTLFEHFRVFKGTSPMRYLRDARLDEAHRALKRGEPDATVTDIATSWGFSHLGRFALDYRRRFGESPRATLAAARIGGVHKAAAADRAAHWHALERGERGLMPGSFDPYYDRAG